MEPDRDRPVGLCSGEGGHVAVGGNAERRCLTPTVGVIRYPMQRTGEQPNVSTRRLHVPREKYTGGLDVSRGGVKELGRDVI